MLQVITSTSAGARLEVAARRIAPHIPAEEVVVVGASRGAADDFVRTMARRLGATFGITRCSLTELAARTAAAGAIGRRPPASDAGIEAVAARVVFDGVAADELEYFLPVASMPGFPKALARTLHELSLAGVTPDELVPLGNGAADLGRMLARLAEQIDWAQVADRATLFRTACDAYAAGHVRWATG